MGVYQVLGKLLFTYNDRIFGWNEQTFSVFETIEAKDAEDAKYRAMDKGKKQARKVWKTATNFSWLDEPSVETQRAISEAEQMNRIGAPRLF